MLMGAAQTMHAIDRADGVIEDRRARGQRAPATGLEAGGAFGRRLAGEHVGDRPRVAAEIVVETLVSHRPRRLGNQGRAALTGEVRPEPLGFDLQSILQLGKRGHVDECPYQPGQESTHAKTTSL